MSFLMKYGKRYKKDHSVSPEDIIKEEEKEKKADSKEKSEDKTEKAGSKKKESKKKTTKKDEPKANNTSPPGSSKKNPEKLEENKRSAKDNKGQKGKKGSKEKSEQKDKLNNNPPAPPKPSKEYLEKIEQKKKTGQDKEEEGKENKNKDKNKQKSYEKIIIGAVFMIIISIVLISFLTNPIGEEEGKETDTGEKGNIESLTCGDCQFKENKSCISYECCNDADCNDGYRATKDTCKKPSTKKARCENIAYISLDNITNIKLKHKTSFDHKGEEHTLISGKTGKESARLIFDDNTEMNFNTGEFKGLDTDNDSIDELRITLVSIKDEYPIISIKELDREITIEGINRTNFEMGEPVEGNFSIEYSGGPLETLITYNYNKEGTNRIYQEMITGNIHQHDEKSYRAFRTEEYVDERFTDSFYSEGNFNYVIDIYDCRIIRAETGKQCDDTENEDIKDIEPISSFSQTITVSGGNSPSECASDDDCNEECTGCTGGTQTCVEKSESCIDCYKDKHCAKGYECINMTCIK
ncbi:MAG: hypothetical protein ACQEP1_01505 [Nanobdellota archaeon]